MNRPKVVITGLGAVSPLGLSVDEMWDGLVQGRSGIGPITAFDPAGLPCRIAGQVPNYKIQDFIPKSSRKAAKLMSRDIELTVIAADQAFRHSGVITQGIDPEHTTLNPERTAINLGAGLISCDLVELAPSVAVSSSEGRFGLPRWGHEGLPLVTPLWLLKYLPNMLACHVSIIHDIQGPSNSITCGEVSAYLAIAEARQIIERGDTDMALAGGAEAKVNPMVMLTQCMIGRATRASDERPEAACRPFDIRAAGSVFGEGAGVLILENADLAGLRGAKVLAEIAGVGHSCSICKDYQSLEPDGAGVRVAVEKALAEARIHPGDLDLIVPHGAAVPGDDLAEARGIEAALGPAVAQIPAWPTKSLLSNTGAASGGLDVVAAVMALRNGLIPAARNCEQRAKGCGLNIRTEPVRQSIRYALCCGHTYGGQTAAIILKNPDLD